MSRPAPRTQPRIVSGTAKGRRLYVPPGELVRPATDRLKQALFNILIDVEDEEVLDLFAGCGSLGIEALSRGAAHSTFADAAPEAVAAIRRNLETCGLAERATVLAGDVMGVLEREPRRPWDLVFIDPPYALGVPFLERIAELLGQPGRLSGSARIAFERATGDPPPPLPAGFEFRLQRSYGQTTLFLAEPTTIGEESST